MFRLLLLLASAISTQGLGRENSRGCTAPFLQADKPFVVVWNEPSASCGGLNLSNWDIVENKGGRFTGINMTLFYNIGDWPYFTKKGTEYVAHNGGIPQVADKRKHFQKVEADTRSTIPEKDFDGLAVIDFESWRPYLDFNFDSLAIYQRKSVDLVKARYPTWTNKSRIWAEATREFQIAARLFMDGTLREVRALRPRGRWGYYGFPRCFGVSKSRLTCSYPATSIANDEIGWMFKDSTALFPRIYTDPRQPLKYRWESVREQINETLRVQAKFADLSRPIMPYTMCQRGKYFFNEDDLSIAIKEAADMGASGVVLWGSSSWFRLPNECRNLQAYIKQLLGPFAKTLSEFMTSCYLHRCSGHGRCVRKDYEAMTQKHLFENNQSACRKPLTEFVQDIRNMPTEIFEFGRTKAKEDIEYSRNEDFRNEDDTTQHTSMKPFRNYVCRCLPGWRGPRCSKPD